MVRSPPLAIFSQVIDATGMGYRPIRGGDPPDCLPPPAQKEQRCRGAALILQQAVLDTSKPHSSSGRSRS